MKNDNAADVLNSLIIINNDRIAGYQTAIEETEDADLKTLFSQFIQTSQACRSELVAEVNRIGGKPNEGTRLDGKIYRSWMEFKSMVTGKDRKAILSSCEKGEDVALNAYEKALKDKDLPSSLTSVVTAQYNKIKMNHNEVRNMRDTAVNA
jgi:uncharacterized protein (TIGR02284 family)